MIAINCVKSEGNIFENKMDTFEFDVEGRTSIILYTA